ncbi:integrase catalytic domain-containing protein [Vairimorpha necatrix]|uniref:Integrase catalytic domain-containing protein n=1 Tax=Vairimorpha necatrix TaxID=6039 RepID=A0AAX4JBA3_9MICR
MILFYIFNITCKIFDNKEFASFLDEKFNKEEKPGIEKFVDNLDTSESINLITKDNLAPQAGGEAKPQAGGKAGGESKPQAGGDKKEGGKAGDKKGGGDKKEGGDDKNVTVQQIKVKDKDAKLVKSTDGDGTSIIVLADQEIMNNEEELKKLPSEIGQAGGKEGEKKASGKGGESKPQAGGKGGEQKAGGKGGEQKAGGKGGESKPQAGGKGSPLINSPSQESTQEGLSLSENFDSSLGDKKNKNREASITVMINNEPKNVKVGIKTFTIIESISQEAIKDKKGSVSDKSIQSYQKINTPEMKKDTEEKKNEEIKKKEAEVKKEAGKDKEAKKKAEEKKDKEKEKEEKKDKEVTKKDEEKEKDAKKKADEKKEKEKEEKEKEAKKKAEEKKEEVKKQAEEPKKKIEDKKKEDKKAEDKKKEDKKAEDKKKEDKKAEDKKKEGDTGNLEKAIDKSQEKIVKDAQKNKEDIKKDINQSKTDIKKDSKENKEEIKKELDKKEIKYETPDFESASKPEKQGIWSSIFNNNDNKRLNKSEEEASKKKSENTDLNSKKALESVVFEGNTKDMKPVTNNNKDQGSASIDDLLYVIKNMPGKVNINKDGPKIFIEGDFKSPNMKDKKKSEFKFSGVIKSKASQ